MSTLDDDRLVERARGGDLASFNALVERYQGQLYSLSLRNVGDRQLAEDVTQEAFIAAWRGIGSFKGGSFKAWLYKIALNQARDLHRRNARHRAGSLDELLEQGPVSGLETRDQEGPEASALASASRRHLEDCLRKLPEDYRTVVLLSDVQGLSYEEMAESLGLPLGTVKSRLFRARGALRKLLIEAGELSRGG